MRGSGGLWAQHRSARANAFCEITGSRGEPGECNASPLEAALLQARIFKRNRNRTTALAADTRQEFIENESGVGEGRLPIDLAASLRYRA